jgi:protein TonB
MNRRTVSTLTLSLVLHLGAFAILHQAMKANVNSLSQSQGGGASSGPLRMEWGIEDSPEAPALSENKTASKPSSHSFAASKAKQSTDTSSAISATSGSGQETGLGSHSGAGVGTNTGNGSGPITVGTGDPYYSEVRARIQSHVQYTPSLARRRIQGEVQVSLTLLPNGSVSSLNILRSSGSEELDHLALESVKAALPFPTFPASSPARAIYLPIAFRLH